MVGFLIYFCISWKALSTLIFFRSTFITSSPNNSGFCPASLTISFSFSKVLWLITKYLETLSFLLPENVVKLTKGPQQDNQDLKPKQAEEIVQLQQRVKEMEGQRSEGAHAETGLMATVSRWRTNKRTIRRYLMMMPLNTYYWTGSRCQACSFRFLLFSGRLTVT